MSTFSKRVPLTFVVVKSSGWLCLTSLFYIQLLRQTLESCLVSINYTCISLIQYSLSESESNSIVETIVADFQYNHHYDEIADKLHNKEVGLLGECLYQDFSHLLHIERSAVSKFLKQTLLEL